MLENKSPLISVVICTYNREKFIKNCLDCLKIQTLAFIHFEVLIVDNNSKDKSASIIKNFIDTNPTLPFSYYFEENQGLSFARNRGIKEANGKWVTYIDDDAEAAVDFLSNLKVAIEKYPKAIGFGGCVLPKYSETKEPVWMNKFLYGFVGSIDLGGDERIFEGRMKFPIGCNMTYKKEILQKVNGFNANLKARSDDKYIYREVIKISNYIYYIPNMKVKHNIDTDRLCFSNFKKLYMKTGNEEKIRMSGNFFSMTFKLIEYLFKLLVSVGVWISYLLKREEIKGRYVFYCCYYTLLGFIKKNVFVR